MNDFKFPKYLAFGTLNPESIRTEGDYQVADYYLLEEKVHEVKVSTQWAYFIEFFKGKQHAITFNPILQGAVQSHFSFWKPSQSPVMDFLVKKTCSLGNFYFGIPSDDRTKTRLSFYPAGMMFIFRIPTTKERLSDDDLFIFDPYVSRYCHSCYTTTLSTMDWSGEIFKEEIELLELIVPLDEIYHAAKRLVFIELVQKERKYRVIIEDVVNKATSVMQVFPSIKNEPYQAYWIEYEQKPSAFH